MAKSCFKFLVLAASTLHVSINLRMPLQNWWLEEICTKSSRFMLTNCWTQQHWKICCCSLTWVVMSVLINTTNACAEWASTWTRTENIVYWGSLKAILVEEARKNSCYLSQRTSVILHPCHRTGNSSGFASWSISSGTEAEGNRAGMGEGIRRHLGSLSARERNKITSCFSQEKAEPFIKCVPALEKDTWKCWMFLLCAGVCTWMRSLFPSQCTEIRLKLKPNQYGMSMK